MSNNDTLYRAKESLEEAKRQFLKELNKKDPNWRDKMRTRKLEEIKRLELNKDKLAKELVERQKKLEEELLLNEQIRHIRDEVDVKNEQMRAIDRQRRSINLEQDVNAKRRELEDLERKINDERRNQHELNQNEKIYREYDKRLQENVQPNQNVGPSIDVNKAPVMTTVSDRKKSGEQ